MYVKNIVLEKKCVEINAHFCIYAAKILLFFYTTKKIAKKMHYLQAKYHGYLRMWDNFTTFARNF